MTACDPLPEGLRPGGRFRHWRQDPCAYVVCDVDGTLLGDAHLATDRVVAATRELARAGVVGGFATGREWAGVAAVQRQLGLPGPHVLFNGAEVRAGVDVIARWELPAGVVDDLLEMCAGLGAYAELYVGEGFLATDLRAHARAHWALLGMEPREVVGDRRAVELPAALKACVVLSADSGPSVEEALPALQRLDASVSVSWAPMTPQLTYVNVTAHDVDKGSALAVAAQHLEVPLEAVACVGDGLNDVPLLRAAGTAIAMGQAPEELRAVAHLVVPEVADDGVAHALAAVAAWARP